MTHPMFLANKASTLKRTLDTILVDKAMTSKLILNKYCESRDMTDAYHDDLDVAGPGLASMKPEGQQIALGSTQEGVKWRYTSRTYALMCQASRELLADGKYEKAIDFKYFLREAMLKTCEYLAVSMLINRDDSNYLGGDGVTLGSASHPVTRGGLYSNIASTPAGPSTSAYVQAVQDLLVLPGRDGLIQTVMPKKVVYPAAQWGAWRTILESEKDPAPGNFSAINVVRGGDIGTPTAVMVPYWQGADDDWAIITDVSKGITWRWRENIRSNSWVDNNTLVTNFSFDMRVGYGWSDPRGIYFGGSA